MSSTLRNLTVLAVVAAAAAPLALAQEVSPDDRDLLWARSKPPNVLLILDSGATMANDPETNSIPYIAGADDPSSKLYQAKEVLQSFVLTFPEFNMGFTYYQKTNIEVHYTNFLYRVRERVDTDGDGVPDTSQPPMLDGTAPGDLIRMGSKFDPNHNVNQAASPMNLPAWDIRFGSDGAEGHLLCLSGPCADPRNRNARRVVSYLIDPETGNRKVAGSAPFYYPAYDWTQVSSTTQNGINGTSSWSAIASGQGLDLTDPTWREAVHDYALADIQYRGSPWGQVDLGAWKATATSNQIGSQVLHIKEELQDWDTSGRRWVTARAQVTHVEFVKQFVIYDRPVDESTLMSANTLAAVEYTGNADCTGYIEQDGAANNTPIVDIPQWDDPNPFYSRRLIASYMQPQPTPLFYFPNYPGSASSPYDAYQPKQRARWIPFTENVIAAGRRPIKDSLNEAEFFFRNDVFQRDDPYKECRKNFVILVTDGDETCSNEQACCTAATDIGKKGIAVFVIAYGPPDLTQVRVLQCVAANSGGELYSASNAAGLAAALRAIGLEIERRTRGFSSPVVPSVQSSTDQVAYIASFFPEGDKSVWRGELFAYLINPLTGQIPLTNVAPAGDPPVFQPDTNEALWKTHEVLQTVSASARNMYYGEASGFGLTIPAERYPFTFTDGSTANDTRIRSLVNGALTDAQLETTVDFIRGDRDPAVYDGYKLGDIFHSTPEIFGRPACYTCYLNDQYAEFGDGYRSVFRAEHAKRRQVVFLGANDGAMHAIDAAFWDADTDRYDTGTGVELFAWLPRETMPTLDDLAFGLDQRWTVDGPPTVADVYVDPSIDAVVPPDLPVPDASEREWRTLLLFGERQGGRSIVVLDVTTPDPYDADDDGMPVPGSNRMPGCLEGTAAGCSGKWPALRFELTDTTDEDGNLQPDMGFTWSRPLVGFLKVEDGDDAGTDPDDVSVAIFGGGYDRATVTGNWLYIVNLETGAILLKENVIGKAAGQVAATDLNLDGYFERIYWGTTDGKIWRMDVDTPGELDAGNRIDNWTPYVLFNAGSSADPGQGPGTTNQPFFLEPKIVPISFDATGYPVLAIALGSGNRDNLFFETSEYNRFYLVVDRNDGATVTEANLQAVAVDAAATTSNYLNDPNLRGWYLILSDGYEKTNTTALVVDQYVIFSTFAPSEVEVYPPDSGLCRVRGNAKTYVVNLWNANPVGDSRFVEHTGVEGRPPVLATDPVLYTGADGEVHVLQSLDDLQLTEPIESWAIPLRVFSWKED